eukprot:jgi/Galph1/1708/GphlegSOOS_G363.1
MPQVLLSELPGVGTLTVQLSPTCTVQDLEKVVWGKLGFCWPLNFLFGGKSLKSQQELVRVPDGALLQTRLVDTLKGGKGGFGTTLRGQAAFRRKSDNISACRDLEGRRIRDLEAEKHLSKWYEDRTKQSTRTDQSASSDRQTEKKRKEWEAAKEQVGQTCRVVEENTDNAVAKGLAMAANKRKRRLEEKQENSVTKLEKATKKRSLFLFSDLDDDSLSESSPSDVDDTVDATVGKSSCVKTEVCSVVSNTSLEEGETPRENL